MIYLYILAAVVLLGSGVGSCNYVLRVKAESASVALRAKAALEAEELAKANLAAVEKNAAETQKLQAEAEKKARIADAQFAKAKEELRALKNRKPVPKECADACRDDFAPVAGVIRGMLDDDNADRSEGAAPP